MVSFLRKGGFSSLSFSPQPSRPSINVATMNEVAVYAISIVLLIYISWFMVKTVRALLVWKFNTVSTIILFCSLAFGTTQMKLYIIIKYLLRIDYLPETIPGTGN